MVSLVRASRAKGYPADITLVISNRPEAPGLAHATAEGVQSMAIDHKAFENRLAFDKALDAVLRQANIELVCCAGFMRVLTPYFVEKWTGKIINIHPSLLPKYKGLNTHQRAIDAGDAQHGVSVHWVGAELDGGDVIARSALSISEHDSAESLAARILPLELALYPRVLKAVATAALTGERT